MEMMLDAPSRFPHATFVARSSSDQPAWTLSGFLQCAAPPGQTRPG